MSFHHELGYKESSSLATRVQLVHLYGLKNALCHLTVGFAVRTKVSKQGALWAPAMYVVMGIGINNPSCPLIWRYSDPSIDSLHRQYQSTQPILKRKFQYFNTKPTLNRNKMSSTTNSSMSMSDTTSWSNTTDSSRLQQRLKARRDRQTLGLIVAVGRAFERDQAREAEAQAATRDTYSFRRGQVVERTLDTSDVANKGTPTIGKAPWWGWAKTDDGSYVIERGMITGMFAFKHFILVEPVTAEDKEAMLVADLADIQDMHREDEKRQALGNALVAVPRVNQRMLGFYIPCDEGNADRPLVICEGKVVDAKQDYQFCFVEPR
jgi:hypothetical protein